MNHRHLTDAPWPGEGQLAARRHVTEQQASWDPATIEAGQVVAAREARAVGIHWAFAPMVDIARDPRWGRIVEGAGEGPFLGAVVAAAQVRGLQGRNPKAIRTATPLAGGASPTVPQPTQTDSSDNPTDPVHRSRPR